MKNEQLAGLFEQNYFSYKRISPEIVARQSARFADITEGFFNQSSGITEGAKANLIGTTTEILAQNILGMFLPAFTFQITPWSIDQIGADIFVYNGNLSPDLAIDIKTRQSHYPNNKNLDVPLLLLCFPTKYTGVKEYIKKLSEGNIVSPYEEVNEIGIEGYRARGLTYHLGIKAGKILRNYRMSHLSNEDPVKVFLRGLVEV